MFRFESFGFLYWIWIVFVFLILIWVLDNRARGRIAKTLGARLGPFLTSSLSLSKRRFKWFLQAFVLLGIIFALARPQMGLSKQEVKAQGFELIIAIDVSESMKSEDVKPSRLEQAKKEVERLMDLMPANKVGLIAFAGNASLISPLTNDPNAIKMYVDSLTSDSVSEQGTCFECALRLAKEAFERGGVTQDEFSKSSRVILISSDGEDHEPGALEAAAGLVKQGVRIFTMAYGTEKGGAIPTRDHLGYLKGYKKDQSGQTILTTVQGDELRKIAEAGHGAFFFTSFGGDHLKNLVEEFEKLEKSQFESTVTTNYDEKFQGFLLFAILFGILEIILGERRSRFRFWKGRYETPKG
jgi:Ca-activated chloride channel family protein